MTVMGMWWMAPHTILLFLIYEIFHIENLHRSLRGKTPPQREPIPIEEKFMKMTVEGYLTF